MSNCSCVWLRRDTSSEMAGGGVVSHGGGNAAQYEGRVTVYVVLACIVAASGGLLFGYDIGISGTIVRNSVYSVYEVVI